MRKLASIRPSSGDPSETANPPARLADRARGSSEGERVPVRLGDDPVAHAFVEDAEVGRVEERAGVRVRQSLWAASAGRRNLAVRVALGEDHEHALGFDSARNEGQHLRRPVEPLRVIDDEDERRPWRRSREHVRTASPIRWVGTQPAPSRTRTGEPR